MSDIKSLEAELLRSVDAASDEAALEALRVSALGKKGVVTELLKSLGAMTADERKVKGPAINGLKESLTSAIQRRREVFSLAALDAKLAAEKLDMTLPAPPRPEGRIHPLTQVLDEFIEIFGSMGFSIAEGPDIETDDYNFTMLNIAPDHPARQMHDTFYFPEKDDGTRLLLRTQTSPIQIRTMLNQKPPIRIIAPGRVYRSDSDQTHTPQFHQIEALVIDETTHLGHLKWTIETFCKAFFEVESVEMRFRPSHFPFTEPSVEVDIRCDRSGGQIRFGEGRDWLEILGGGMVHPKVLENCGLDPAHYQGFALGMGLDRMALLKYGIPDLREFFNSDLRWLRHYGFSVLDVPSLAAGLTA